MNTLPTSYHSLGKFSRRQIDDIRFIYFQEIGFDIPGKLFPPQEIILS